MDEMEKFLRRIVSDSKSPSVQYILFDNDHIIKEYRFGLADIKTNLAIDQKTTYHAFSVTKTFTALAVLQLAEHKKLDIDHPVKNYLPVFPYPAIITIRQLLSHSAGIPNPIPLSWIHLIAERQNFGRDQFFQKIFLKHNKTKADPNHTFSYSNLGYVLLGQLIESVAGLSYEEYITRHIISRLGLKNEDLGFEIQNSKIHAKGYHKRWSFSNLVLGLFIDKEKFMEPSEKSWKPFRHYYINGVAYGGLIGTPLAFVKYIQHLLQPNSLLLSDAYKKILFTENITNNNKPTGMCLSWFKGQLKGYEYFTHAGGGGGYYCEVRIYPGKGTGSVVFLNRTGFSDERMLDKIDAFYIDSIV